MTPAGTQTASPTSAATTFHLPSPHTEGGKPLMQALKLRHSTRAYSSRALTAQTLSDLLWAAFGVNRPSGDRTAPYWRHVMVLDIYAAMADGVWLYEPGSHALLPHLDADIRPATGLQDFVGTAPLDLIYVAHGERMTDISRRGASPLRLGECRLHRSERLSLLRVGRPRDGVSRRGGPREARPRVEASGGAVRYLRPDGRSRRLNSATGGPRCFLLPPLSAY